ncbi:hypothetical protein K440DRAFT_646308 [Wilcoxina mikolae CBS 423.85]|nr:hypothetical protein K440DRAFT_646308 [Wilcoxina mikolae CBS 423.85]
MDGNGEEVSEFLLRIRELGDRRDKEDDERARKLEAEILAGREARRARRDERARSLSPQKDSPVGTPISLKSISSTRPGTRDGEDPSGRVDNSTGAALEKLTGKLAGVTVGGGSEATSDSPAPAPSPVLSWQRRPKSAYGLSKIPPLSPSTNGPNDNETSEKSRAQIAASLGTKDPTWFKQTQDRAATSGALRKAEEESLGSVSKKALPGMLPLGDNNALPRSSTPEPQKGPPRTPTETLSMGRVARSGSLQSDRFIPSMTPGASGRHERSPSLSSNTSGRFELESNEGFVRPPPMSPSQGRISPERGDRTPSPTKGFGGFVQSAMLKREGSINKRWSRTEQGAGGLSRNDSVATARSSYTRSTTGRDQGSTVAQLSRESTPAPEEFPFESTKPEASDNSFQTLRGRSKTISASGDRPLSFHAQRDSTPPASPTKTYEQKRWSPTKSSWLETALKKGTDNPQPPMAPAKPLERTPSKYTTNEKSMDSSYLSKPTVNSKPPALSPKSIPSQVTLKKAAEKPPEEPTLRTRYNDAPIKSIVAEKSAVFNRGSTILSPTTVGIDGPSIPIKPTVKPKEPLNFRASLKPRPTTDQDGEKEELPFLSAMSRLRSTKTQNYRAPNELKDRILEGKAKLNTTGGPQRSVRPDPLKETLLSAKVALKPSETSPTRPNFSPTEPKPPPFEKKVSAPGRLETEKKGPSLADRFNPALSNLLQRGPPTAASGNSFRSSRSTAESAVSSKPKEVATGGPAESSTPLTHMTKGRARGPKRRAPTKAEPNATPAAPERVNLDVPTARTATRSPSPRPLETPKKVPSRVELSRKTSSTSLGSSSAQKSEKPKPPTPAKSPLLRGTSSSSLKENEKLPTEPATIQEDAIKIPPTIKSPSSKVVSREPSLSTLSSTPTAKVEEPSDPIKRTGVSPITLPKRGGERKNFGISGFPGFSGPPEVVEPEEKPLPRLFSRTVTPLPENAESDAIEKDNSRLLSQFFRGPSFRANKIDFDMMSILAANPALSTEKVRTTKFEISEITGYGKLNAIPNDEQHVLFDENMYLCIHSFEGVSGTKKIEVYLWSGVKVSESAIEDAQLFARKTARENDGKLIQLKQGRETPAFFQAIGGILITRRGTREKTSADSSFMLCGRNCFGGVAFDEVDMGVSTLCSGFPYIVSRKGGVYLWKGKGATPEEIGVARLVGFEISGGEVKEFAEGDEPDAFFDALGGYSEIMSADYWHLKPSCKKYAARLFKIDLQTQSKVVEISPFCQDDLDPREIYVADAFFEFYIVIGSQSQSKREEFQVALQFTQAYALLAVSVEDRPFIPVSSVILGGAPREFKALFRTWDNAKIPTQWQPSRKPSLRLIGLPQAMEAMNI